MWYDCASQEYQYLFVYRVLFVWLAPRADRLSRCLDPETANHIALRLVPICNALAWVETWLVRMPLIGAALIILVLLTLLPGVKPSTVCWEPRYDA